MPKEIRPWRLDDLPAVRDVLWKTWLSTYASFIPENDLRSYLDEQYTLERLDALYQNPRVRGFVAEVEGAVVGVMRTTASEQEQRFYLNSLYILPLFQSLGLGSAFMEKAAEEARADNRDRLWLGVMAQNRSALEWYKKVGYTIVEDEPFTLGATTIRHYIGYILLESIERTLSRRVTPAHH